MAELTDRHDGFLDAYHLILDRDPSTRPPSGTSYETLGDTRAPAARVN